MNFIDREQEHEQGQQVSSYTENLQTLGDPHRSIQDSGQEKFNAAARRDPSFSSDYRKTTDKQLKLMIENAMSFQEKNEIAYWYRWICFEQDLIKKKKRPAFPKPPKISSSLQKRISMERRGKILSEMSDEPLTANEISKRTGLNIWSTSIFMHNLFRDGMVNRSTTSIRKDKKDKVYLYSQLNKTGSYQ